MVCSHSILGIKHRITSLQSTVPERLDNKKGSKRVAWFSLEREIEEISWANWGWGWGEWEDGTLREWVEWAGQRGFHILKQNSVAVSQHLPWNVFSGRGPWTSNLDSGAVVSSPWLLTNLMWVPILIFKDGCCPLTPSLSPFWESLNNNTLDYSPSLFFSSSSFWFIGFCFPLCSWSAQSKDHDSSCTDLPRMEVSGESCVPQRMYYSHVVLCALWGWGPWNRQAAWWFSGFLLPAEAGVISLYKSGTGDLLLTTWTQQRGWTSFPGYSAVCLSLAP